jgi:hypothetical protein
MATTDKNKWQITLLEKTSEEEAKARLRSAQIKLLACGLDASMVRFDGSGNVVWVAIEMGPLFAMLGDGSEFYTAPSTLGSQE